MVDTVEIKITDHPGESGTVRDICLSMKQGPNRFSRAMIAALQSALEEAERSDEVTALVISHGGKAFCAGTDLSELAGLHADAQALRGFLGGLVSFLRAVERSPKPTVAAIDGAAVGGGFELALACDFRVMSGSAWAALPETGLGTIPGGGGVQTLSRFLGRARTLDLVLTGRRLSAEECACLGLALRVEGSARDAALELARKLSDRSLHALAVAKEIILKCETTSDDDLDRMAIDGMVETLCGPEGVEGLRAIAERREPEFHRVRGAR